MGPGPDQHCSPNHVRHTTGLLTCTQGQHASGATDALRGERGPHPNKKWGHPNCMSPAVAGPASSVVWRRRWLCGGWSSCFRCSPGRAAPDVCAQIPCARVVQPAFSTPPQNIIKTKDSQVKRTIKGEQQRVRKLVKQADSSLLGHAVTETFSSMQKKVEEKVLRRATGCRTVPPDRGRGSTKRAGTASGARGGGGGGHQGSVSVPPGISGCMH